jgi:hypothetical protein
MDSRWGGNVEEIVFNEHDSSAIMYMGNLKPVIRALPSPVKHTMVAKTALEFKLKDLSWAVLSKEYREKESQLCKWERDVYMEAIAERRDATAKLLDNYHQLGLEAALEEAKKKGRKVLKEQRGDKTVYFDDDTSEVIYECPVTLH